MKALPVQGLSCTHDATFIAMANAEHITKLNEGIEAWNLWRTDQRFIPDLSEADFSGRNLSGADLRGANFENANLQGATIGRGTMLRDANFHHANLCHANLSGADFQDAHFAEADMRDASLREANLLGADLSEAVGGLRTEQYAGADLTGAKLPEPLKKLYDGLENVKGISESARKIFLAVLAGCLYCWLTIATTTDVNLITNRASSPLPIIQTPIPIVGFYAVAPLLVLCVYFYFHFYLQKLWEELGSLPAVFPDGRPLHAKVDPWLLNDLVRSHLPRLNANRPFLSYLQLWISVLLAWWIVPLTMFLFWGRYLRRHEQIGTAFHVFLLIISSVAAVSLYRLAVATLLGVERGSFTWKRALTGRRGYRTLALAVAAGVSLGLISWGAILGDRSKEPLLGIAPAATEVYFPASKGPRAWIAQVMALSGYPPFANLTNADISQRQPLVGASLKETNLRYASAGSAFLSGADLEGADMTGAYLSGADISHAELFGVGMTLAHLVDANLTDSYLGGASLRRAHLGGAHLREAHMSNADLSGPAWLAQN